MRNRLQHQITAKDQRNRDVAEAFSSNFCQEAQERRERAPERLQCWLAMKVFEPFRLDTVNHCVWRAEERLPLTPKAFDVLRYLVEHADRLVTQDEILEAIWPETYVNPEAIRKYILEIRRVLGDRPSPPLFIETLPKRGYRFVAKVTDDRTPSAASTEAGGNMVGRDVALAQINNHFEKALSGQRQVVFVTGEAGIGKTTLVDTFQQQAARHPNLRLARGQCIEGFGGTEAYYPMLEALGSLVRNAQDDAMVQTLAKQAPTWLAQFPSLVKTEQRDWLQREILGSTRGRMVREICEALEAMTEQAPLIVILEDLHWADTSTFDWISAFARRREPAKLLLVGTYRPVDVVLSQSPLKALKQDLEVRHLCSEVAIERLQESDVAEYLAKTFANSNLPSGLASLIHHNSGGNALFMAAIVRDIAKRGLIAQVGGAWALTAPLQAIYPGIPETLQQMLDLLFEQLSAEEQQILQGCSVAGERFSVWAASVILETLPASVEEACDKLAQRQQFIRFAGIHKAANGADSAHYEFRHALYRQALYRSLPRVSRTKFHRSLGERLMPFCTTEKPELASELALHFEEGRDFEQAARCLMLASQNAAKRFSHRDSIQVLRHALKLISGQELSTGFELEIQILERIGDAQFTLGEMSESLGSYESASSLAADADSRAKQIFVLTKMALAAWFIDAVRGNQVCERALQVSRSLSDPLLLARTELAVACLRLLYDSWRVEDEEVCARALTTIRSLAGFSSPLHVYHTYVQVLQGEYEQARKQADALIDTATDPTTYTLAFGGRGFMLMATGRFGEMLQLVRNGQEVARKNESEAWIWVMGEAWLRAHCFDFDGVHRLGEFTMPTDGESHAAWTRTAARIAAGYMEIAQGNHEKALESFAQIRDYEITPKFFLHWHWRMHAVIGTIEACLSAGNILNARREADGLLESALAVADPNLHALAWEINSRVCRAEKDSSGARECIAKALAIVDKREIPVSGWRVHATAWELYTEEGESEKAGRHRGRAQEMIMSMADSFEQGEPMRETFLAAAPVQRILSSAVSA